MKKFKTDWEEALARLTAWWAGEKTDRVVALVTAPREGVSPRPINKKVPDMYINPEVVFANLEASLEATFWGGESLPNHWVYLGPVPLSGYLGCEMHFQENTVWHTPCFSSLKEHNKLRFTPENKWYQLLCGLTRASVQRSRGQYLVSGQGFGAASDVMADLWGAEKILVATVEEPGVVKKIVRQLTDISCKLYDELDALVAPFQTGSFDWLRLWAPGRMWTIQSDISCMLSPKIFSELILPELIRETEHVDFCFYHLDGPGAIKHLDSLLCVSALDGIQWVPGAGASGDPLNWLELFRRIQSAGKRVMVSCPPERIKPLLDRVDRRLLCLSVSCRSQKEAEAVLGELDRLGT